MTMPPNLSDSFMLIQVICHGIYNLYCVSHIISLFLVTVCHFFSPFFM